MNYYLTNVTVKNNNKIKMFLKTIGYLPLFFSLNIYGMDQKHMSKIIPDQHISSQDEQVSSIPAYINVPFTATSVVKNCGNNNKKANLNDNRNECNPINKNVVNVTVIGAIGTELLKLLDPARYNGIINSSANLCKATGHWLMNNKKISAGAFVGTLYLGLNARLMYLYSKLSRSSCWSQWRSNLAIEELYLLPRQTLYNDLLTNIQTKYTNFKNFRDSMAPLSCFLEDTEKEEVYIKQYESIVKLLKLTHIGCIVFYSHNLYKQLSKRSSRLLFIKSAFLNWLAERKLSSPEKELLVRRFPRIRSIFDTTEHDFAMDNLITSPLLPEESTDTILENIVII